MSNTQQSNQGNNSLIPDITSLQNDISNTLSTIHANAEKISEVEIIVSALTDIDESAQPIDTNQIAQIWYGVHQYQQTNRLLNNNFYARQNKIKELLKDNPTLSEISSLVSGTPETFQNSQINIEPESEILNGANTLLSGSEQSPDVYQKFATSVLNSSSNQTAWAKAKITEIQNNAQLNDTQKQQQIKNVAQSIQSQAEAAKLLKECSDLATVINSNGSNVPQNSTLDADLLKLTQQMKKNSAIYTAARERYQQFAEDASANLLMKEMMQSANEEGNPFMNDLVMALVGSTVAGQNYSANSLKRLYEEVHKISPKQLNNHFSYADQKELIEWALANTANESEKQFLTRIKNEYNYDLTAYLKKQISVEDISSEDDMAGKWTKMMQEMTFSNASTKFFRTIKNRREGKPDDYEEIQNRDNRSQEKSASNSNGNHHNEQPPEKTQDDGNPGGNKQNSGPSTDTPKEFGKSGNDSSQSKEDTISIGINTADSANKQNKFGSSNDGSSILKRNFGQTSSLSDMNDFQTSLSTNDDNQDVSDTGTSSNNASSNNTSLKKSSEKGVSKKTSTKQPAVQPKSKQMYRSTNGGGNKTTPSKDDKKKSIAIMQANAEQNDESWWSRNMSWILTVIGILATAGIAYFFIRKYKKDSDKSKKEADTLKSTVTDLQNKVTDLTKGNEGNSQTTDTQTNIGSTLANNATVVGNADINSVRIITNGNTNSNG